MVLQVYSVLCCAVMCCEILLPQQLLEPTTTFVLLAQVASTTTAYETASVLTLHPYCKLLYTATTLQALADFLEQKRSALPRFYFIGDDDLLEILGQAKNPTVIQEHLKKLFQGTCYIAIIIPDLRSVLLFRVAPVYHSTSMLLLLLLSAAVICA
jgi:Dynein heavy chain, N-terminal region 2